MFRFKIHPGGSTGEQRGAEMSSGGERRGAEGSGGELVSLPGPKSNKKKSVYVVK